MFQGLGFAFNFATNAACSGVARPRWRAVRSCPSPAVRGGPDQDQVQERPRYDRGRSNQGNFTYFRRFSINQSISRSRTRQDQVLTHAIAAVDFEIRV